MFGLNAGQVRQHIRQITDVPISLSIYLNCRGGWVVDATQIDCTGLIRLRTGVGEGDWLDEALNRALEDMAERPLPVKENIRGHVVQPLDFEYGVNASPNTLADAP